MKQKLLIIKRNSEKFHKTFETNITLFSLYFGIENIYILSNQSYQNLNFIERKNHLIIDIINSIYILKNNVYVTFCEEFTNPLLIEEFLKLNLRYISCSVSRCLSYDRYVKHTFLNNDFIFLGLIKELNVLEERYKLNDFFFFPSCKDIDKIPITNKNMSFEEYLLNCDSYCFISNNPTFSSRLDKQIFDEILDNIFNII